MDFHYLSVFEALKQLDAFLDLHISELKANNAEEVILVLITGKGRHSPGGHARIKPAVIDRLEKRGIQYVKIPILSIKLLQDVNFCI